MASVAVQTEPAKSVYTPEDLLTMPDGDRYDLVDGKLVERNMSFWSSYVALTAGTLLRVYCLAHNLGWVVPEGTSYQCFPLRPGKVRKPDVSFIRLDRLTLAQAIVEGHIPIHPDLAAEVISPRDVHYEVDEKVDEWLKAGVGLVWVINPRRCSVRVHRADGAEIILHEQDELSGEQIVPGFHCRVGDLFLAPTGVVPDLGEPADGQP